MEAPEQTTLDYSKVPHIAGVPRYLYRTFFKSLGNMIAAGRDQVASFEYELWLWFFAGIVKQRFQDRIMDTTKEAKLQNQR
jgi:hypothetical protein